MCGEVKQRAGAEALWRGRRRHAGCAVVRSPDSSALLCYMLQASSSWLLQCLRDA